MELESHFKTVLLPTEYLRRTQLLSEPITTFFLGAIFKKITFHIIHNIICTFLASLMLVRETIQRSTLVSLTNIHKPEVSRVFSATLWSLPVFFS